MRKIILLVTFFAFAFLCVPAAVFAQQSGDSSSGIEESRMTQSKELRDEYKEMKEDLEIQLKKLQKDREIARRDKNFSLVERRTREIKQTKARIAGLAEEYGVKNQEMFSEEQKNGAEPDADFYAGELAEQQAKMKSAEKKAAAGKKTQGKKKQAPKKKAPAKK